MANLQELTPNSWIFKSNTNDKIGIVSYNDETEKYLLIAPGIDIEFNSLDELTSIINETIKIEARENVKAQNLDINGYPIAHSSPTDIVECSGVIRYNTQKSKKIFLAGYWCTPAGENALDTWYARISLSQDVYDKFLNMGITPLGPYKGKTEALFGVKQGERWYKEQNNK